MANCRKDLNDFFSIKKSTKRLLPDFSDSKKTDKKKKKKTLRGW
jgi:hypothetical protein